RPPQTVVRPVPDGEQLLATHVAFDKQLAPGPPQVFSVGEHPTMLVLRYAQPYVLLATSCHAFGRSTAHWAPSAPHFPLTQLPYTQSAFVVHFPPAKTALTRVVIAGPQLLK